MTLVTLAMIYAYFTRPKSGNKTLGVMRFVILVLAAVPIAILTNALRVSGTGVLAHYYGTGVADGFFHSFSGWVVYIVAAALLFATGWFLDRLASFGIDPHLKRHLNRARRARLTRQHCTHESVIKSPLLALIHRAPRGWRDRQRLGAFRRGTRLAPAAERVSGSNRFVATTG